MKKNIILFIWAFVLIIFEAAIGRYIKIGSAYPEIAFVFVMCVAVLDDDLVFVTVISVMCGLMTDCLGGGVVGVNLFFFGIFAVLCSLMTHRFFMPNVFVMTVCTVISAFVSRMLIFTFGFVIFGNLRLGDVFIPLIVSYVIYDAAVGIIMYLIMSRTIYAKRSYDRR